MNLNGTWTLYYALEDANTQNDPAYLREHGECIPAAVPGNVEIDLERAGREPDPFYAENIYRFRKYEFYRWQFERSFTAPEKNGSRWVLYFEGLNNFADIYLNNEKIGETANSFIEHRFDVTDKLLYGQENHLVVLIRSALNEVRKMDIPVLVHTHETGGFQMLRMPASSFGWDIMGRFLSAGMWRGVHLDEVKPDRIVDAYYATRALLPDGSARMRLRYRWDTAEPILDGFTLELDGICGQHRFHAEKIAGFVDGTLEFIIPDAQLWWPKGYGEPSLYTVTLTLKHNGRVLDTRTDRIGVRLLTIDHVLKPNDEGEFLVRANGCPILCKGSNWVPLDALHSRDAERLQAAHDLLEDAGCNIIRCWGGNVYEDHAFFDLCDERGMMVWQDFAMACCVYSQSDAFAAQIEEEATAVVKKLRNHPSILLWAGDNEVDEGIIGQDSRATPCRSSTTGARAPISRMISTSTPPRILSANAAITAARR